MHASLADILTDLAQNSVEAGADRIELGFDEDPREIRLRISDNGHGMDEATLARAEDPFWTDGVKHPGRQVGLGIPFLRQTAEACGGEAVIASTPGEGTTVTGVFPDHLDRPPTGDLVLLWLQCLTFDAEYGMCIRRSRLTADGRRTAYEIERAEVVDALGGLTDAGALGLLRDYLTSLEESLDDIG